MPLKKLMSRQKIRLLELIEENYGILFGNAYSNLVKAAKWEEIREILNGLGPEKTTDQWRRAWVDIRKTVKKKYVRRKAELKDTGGGDLSRDLSFSEEDHWVIRISGYGSKEKPAKVEKPDEDLGESTPSNNFDPPFSSSTAVSSRNVEELCTPVIKKARTDPVEDVLLVETNIDLQKRMVCLQKRQLAVTRQILARQTIHHADQRQFNARVTNLLEAILLQLQSQQQPIIKVESHQ